MVSVQLIEAETIFYKIRFHQYNVSEDILDSCILLLLHILKSRSLQT